MNRLFLGAPLMAVVLGCDGSPVPGPVARSFAAPAPLRPWNGQMTGSALASTSLRPRFQWTAVTGASSYELQVDDSCPATGFSSCGFPSPEVVARDLSSTAYTPDRELVVSLTRPVGRRYFWRVRACYAGSCSSWSPVRYVDVGRMAQDLNGDGYADVMVGTDPGAVPAGRLFLYLGHAAPLSGTPDLVLTADSPGDGFGYAGGPAGDLNADGFPDLLVSAYTSAAAGKESGRAYVFLGRETLKTTPDLVMTGKAGETFGIAISGIGDVNNDGFADFSVTGDAKGPGRAYLYWGGAVLHSVPDLTLTGETKDDAFGYPVRPLQDVNGDGFADVLVGASGNDAGGADAGRGYLYFGGAPMDARADVILTGQAAGDNFGTHLTGPGDVNGDGYADMVVSAYRNNAGGQGAGRVYLYWGGPNVDAVPDFQITGPAAGARFGSVALLDLNGDGFDDLFVASSLVEGRRVFGFFGGAALRDTADLSLAGSDHAGVVAAAGDVNGDGFEDLIVGTYTDEPSALQLGRAYLYSGGRQPSGVAAATLIGPTPGEAFGVVVAFAIESIRAVSGISPLLRRAMPD
jgi:hypothetical protein